MTAEAPPAASPRPGPPGVGTTLLEAARSAVRAVVAGARVAWRVTAPVRESVGAIGWIVLAAAALFLTCGLVLGWAEFVFLALTLLGAIVVSVAFLFGRAEYAVDVQLQPHRVVVGERALGSLTVTNRAPRRSAGSRMELPVGRGLAEFAIPPLEVEAQHEELFAVPTHRRAVILAGPAVTVRGDRLGLLRRVVRWTEPVELFVHPRTARLAASAAGLVRDLEGESTRTITDNDISFHALRPYQRGDALRNVHWRTSARVGQLMVRQYEETRRSELLLAIATDDAGYASEDEFELAISVAASIAIQVIAESTGLTVTSEAVRLRTLSRQTLLDDSCRIEPTQRRFPSLRAFARAAERLSTRPSVAMLVVGSGTDVAAIRAAFTVFGPETERFAIRVHEGASPGVAVVSGITVATVGSLEDLPRVFRKVRP